MIHSTHYQRRRILAVSAIVMLSGVSLTEAQEPLGQVQIELDFELASDVFVDGDLEFAEPMNDRLPDLSAPQDLLAPHIESPVGLLINDVFIDDARISLSDEQIAGIRRDVTDYLQSQIDRLDQVSTLTAEQHQKLEVAVKGMAESFIQRHQQKLVEIVDRKTAGTEEKLTAAGLPRVKAKTMLTSRRMAAAEGVIMCEPAMRLEEDPLWADTVNQLLTDEQAKLLDRAIREWSEQECDLFALQFVYAIDRLIGLTADQRRGLAKLASEHWHQQAEAQDIMSRTVAQQLASTRAPVRPDAMELVGALLKGEAANSLTPSQLLRMDRQRALLTSYFQNAAATVGRLAQPRSIVVRAKNQLPPQAEP
ncbi:MAG: hypothetical protein R3E01_20080 [Pirellulaceae bacterium]|nr:hypothetical protein [Planctomycetales bacterium]